MDTVSGPSMSCVSFLSSWEKKSCLEDRRFMQNLASSSKAFDCIYCLRDSLIVEEKPFVRVFFEDAGFKTLYDFGDLHAMNGRRFTLATSIVNRMAGWKSFIAARNTVASE